MSITLLHGNNQLASREELAKLKKKAQEKGDQIVTLEGKDIEESSLVSVARSQTLEGKETLVIVENFLSEKGVPKATLPGNIVFWEGRILPKTLLSRLPKNWEAKEHSFPQAVFKFLDSFEPGNKKAIFLLRQALKLEPPEKILPLLAWHTRRLIWAKLEPETLRFWKKESLVKQAEKFSRAQLILLHQKLLEIDRGQKTSTLPHSLTSSLDQLVLALSE